MCNALDVVAAPPPRHLLGHHSLKRRRRDAMSSSPAAKRSRTDAPPGAAAQATAVAPAKRSPAAGAAPGRHHLRARAPRSPACARASHQRWPAPDCAGAARARARRSRPLKSYPRRNGSGRPLGRPARPAGITVDRSRVCRERHVWGSLPSAARRRATTYAGHDVALKKFIQRDDDWGFPDYDAAGAQDPVAAAARELDTIA